MIAFHWVNLIKNLSHCGSQHVILHPKGLGCQQLIQSLIFVNSFNLQLVHCIVRQNREPRRKPFWLRSKNFLINISLMTFPFSRFLIFSLLLVVWKTFSLMFKQIFVVHYFFLHKHLSVVQVSCFGLNRFLFCRYFEIFPWSVSEMTSFHQRFDTNVTKSQCVIICSNWRAFCTH